MSISKFPTLLHCREGWSHFFETRRSKEPHVHQIEPTNVCPYTCIMCPRSKHMHRHLGFMEMHLFRKIIDEIATYSEPIRNKEIELFHFGESLIHPEIHDMVGYATRKKLNVSLSVNAPHLTPVIAERILENGLNRLIVSLDGHDQESYTKIRGAAADYLLAIKNLNSLLSSIQKRRPATRICLRIIHMNANEPHLDAFRSEWEAKGIDVEIRSFFPWSEKEMVSLGAVDKYPSGMPCPFPWEYLVVQWDGSVVPCCRDYNGINSLGNVVSQSLKDIWNSDQYAIFRDQHRTGEYGTNSFCHNCMEIYYSQPESMVEHIESSNIIPTLGKSLADLWQEAIGKFANRLLIIDDTDSSRFTYKDADDVVIQVMGRLRLAGMRQGDRLAVYAPQHAESAFIFWAAMRLGLVFVPLDPHMPQGVLKEVLDEVSPVLLFCDAANLSAIGQLTTIPLVVLDDPLDAAIPDIPRFADWLAGNNPSTPLSPIEENHPAVILFTSGTSGKNKGVILSHGALYRSSALMAATYGWMQDDILTTLGDFHTMSGLRNPCLATLHVGASFVVSASEVRANALLVADLLTRQSVTLLTTVPAMIRQFLRVAGRADVSGLAGLRQVLCTGSILPPKYSRDFFRKYNLTVYNYYGLTETAGLCIGTLPHRSGDPASIGYPLDARVRIAGPDGASLPDGKTGELFIQSRNLMSGYLGDPELSAAVLRDGWYATGDLARQDKMGAIYLLGRLGDAIKDRRGEFIHPAEIEQVLESHGKVAEAGVCGITGPDEEEYLAAAIVLNQTSYDTIELFRELRKIIFEQLGSTRLPARFQLIDTLPRGSGGKLLRKQLADQLQLHKVGHNV